MDLPAPYTSRSKQHEPDYSWPAEVKVQLIWMIDGRPHIRSHHITGDEFFGLGNHGAPLEGAALVGLIERLRREGPPEVPARKNYHGGNAKRKTNGRR